MSKKQKKKTIKRIPIHFVVIPAAILTLLLVIGIWVGVTLSSVDTEQLVYNNLAGITDTSDLSDEDKNKLDKYESVDIENASKFGEDAFIKETLKNQKYSYYDAGNLRIALVSTEYKKPVVKDGNLSNGTISFYLGFKALTSTNSISVTSAKVIAADGWSGYVKAASSITSSYYSNTILGYDTMRFYNSTRSISITQEIENRYLLFKKVEHPSIFVYVEYKDKGTTYETIVRFDYEDYFIKGQSIIVS